MFLYGIGLKGLVHAISINVRITAFIIAETVIQFGNQQFWLRICIESRHKSVLGIYISKERNILVAEKFIRSLVGNYGKHTVYTDGGTWYLEACNVLKLKHYLHSPFQKVDGKSQPVLRGQNREF